MANETSTRTFTVRFPNELHRAASTIATQHRKSLNALLQDITEAYLRQQEEKQLFESFTRLGEDLDECDMEYSWDAQREAIDHVNLS